MENSENENKDSLKARLKILQQTIDLFSKGELEFATDKPKKEYHLLKFPKQAQEFNASFGNQAPVLSKYTLQGTGKYNELEFDKLGFGNDLFNDLNDIIRRTLGEDYVIIFCRELDSYKHQQDLFCVKFYNVFNKGQNGNISFAQSRSSFQLGEISNNAKKAKNGQVQIDLDLVYTKAMSYNGVDIVDKNVLFYGFDVESNKYLNYFFGNNPPKAILNIIPYTSNSFVHDNVD
jgi:hypothetical protein